MKCHGVKGIRKPSHADHGSSAKLQHVMTRCGNTPLCGPEAKAARLPISGLSVSPSGDHVPYFVFYNTRLTYTDIWVD